MLHGTTHISITC